MPFLTPQVIISLGGEEHASHGIAHLYHSRLESAKVQSGVTTVPTISKTSLIDLLEKSYCLQNSFSVLSKFPTLAFFCFKAKSSILLQAAGSSKQFRMPVRTEARFFVIALVF